MKPALVVLAAGGSTRLGACKALVPITPRCPLELLLEAGEVLDDVPPMVVTGKDHEAIVRVLERLGRPLIARNGDWERGRTGSVALAAGLRRGLDLCLAPVDVPLVQRGVFAALAQAWESAGSPAHGWLAPKHGERFGHPIVVGRALAACVLERNSGLGADSPLRELRARAMPVFWVDVEDAAVLDDLDGPDDLRRLRARFSV